MNEFDAILGEVEREQQQPQPELVESPGVAPRAPAPRSFDEALAGVEADDERQKDEQLRGLFDVAIQKAPDEHAAVLEMSRLTGAVPDVVEANMPAFRRAVESAKFDPAAFRKQSPFLAQWLRESPWMADRKSVV